MLTLLGECGNAKENLIAIQESVERFIDELQRDEDGDEETSDDQGLSTMLEQLMRMLSLYSSSMCFIFGMRSQRQSFFLSVSSTQVAEEISGRNTSILPQGP